MASTTVLLLVACALVPHGGDAAKKNAAGSALQTYETAFDKDHSGSPIDKLVQMLGEMAKTLDSDLKKDQALHDKMQCWCETNKKEKAAAIEEAEGQAKELTSEIDEETAKSAEYTAKIQELDAGLVEDKQALADAQEVRLKQQKDFVSMEPASAAKVKSLSDAIETLEKHSGVALPQLSLLAFDNAKHQHRTHDVPWANGHETSDERELDDFMRADGIDASAPVEIPVKHEDASSRSGFLLQKARPKSDASPTIWSARDLSVVKKAIHSAKAFVQAKQTGEYFPSYSDKSGEILGTLKQIKEQMEDDLTEARKTETEQASAFEELKEAKTSEIDSSKMLNEEKEDKLGESGIALHIAKRDLKQTEASLSEDQQFLVNLKQTCATADSDFQERKKARMEEISAVSDAISILRTDDAKDNFKQTYSFMQVSSEDSNSGAEKQRKHAATVLKKLAKTGGPQFSALVTSIEQDTFVKVQQAINKTVTNLRQEQEDEVKKNDWCVAEMHALDMDKSKFDNEKADLEAKVSNDGAIVQKMTSEIERAKGEIAQLQVAQQGAAETRQAENTDFQKTVSEQRLTQELLKKALKRLAKFYQDQSFVQLMSHSNSLGAPEQMDYGKNAAGEGALALMKKLILDSKAVEAEAIKGEQQAQAEYESLVQDTKMAIAPLLEQVAAKSEDRAKAASDKVENQEDLDQTVDQLEHLSGEKSDSLHSECDYLLKYFEVRQQARLDEIDQLNKASGFLDSQSK